MFLYSIVYCTFHYVLFCLHIAPTKISLEDIERSYHDRNYTIGTIVCNTDNSFRVLKCNTMDNTNCNICNRKFHNHAKIVECVSCHIRYHLKCITLECEHQAYILFHLLEWICETCNSLIFPFNQLESDNDFLH